jgi:hypothetical protein
MIKQTRMGQAIHDMKAAGYHIIPCSVNPHKVVSPETLGFLQTHHRWIQTNEVPAGTLLRPRAEYMTLPEMDERAVWVEQMGRARKVIPKPSLGETKMNLLLREFPEEKHLKVLYQNDPQETIQLVASVKTVVGRRGHFQRECQALSVGSLW